MPRAAEGGGRRPALMRAYHPATLVPPRSMGGARPSPDLRGFAPPVTAVAPMMLTHQPAVGPRIRRLQFFGADSSMTEIRGLVCRDGDQAAVIELLRDHFMAHAKEWD